MTISDEKLTTAMKLLYNGWFARWRNRVSEDTWQTIMEEGYAAIEDLQEYPAVWNIFISLLYELSARLTGGYTEVTRNKILNIIKEGPCTTGE